MRPHELYLRGIIEAAEAIERFIAGLSKAEFERDELRQSAVIQKLTVIGEAVARLPDSLRNKYPNVPWKAIVGFRNVVVHAYFSVDMDIVWDTATGDVPDLHDKVMAIFGSREA